jgi:hypothetical protein
MESSDAEKRTRDLMANSRHTLDNPKFIAQVIQKVEEENLTIINRQFYLKWTFIILTLEMMIGIALWSLRDNISNLTVLPYAVLDVMKFTLIWMLDYHFFFLPFIIFLIIKFVIDAIVGKNKRLYI